jgi:hypothetical protein
MKEFGLGEPIIGVVQQNVHRIYFNHTERYVNVYIDKAWCARIYNILNSKSYYTIDYKNKGFRLHNSPFRWVADSGKVLSKT